LKKKLIILLHGPLSKREFQTFGIEVLKKNFNLSIVEISPLVNSEHYKFKRNFNFKIIRNFQELEKFFQRNKNSMCWETGFSYNSIRIALLLRKYNIKVINADGISSLPTKRFLYKTKHYEIFLRRIKLLFFNPFVFFNRLSFFLEAWLRILRYKKIDIALIGGDAYASYNGYKEAKDKIYCSSLDYGFYLSKKKNNLNLGTKNYAVFIDTYFPFHPEHSSTTGRFIKPKKHFESLINFFNEFESATKLEIIVALYPKADLKKYPKEFKKYKLIPNKITELVKNCKVVLHHGSTAQSYAVLFKKPAIYLTTNLMEKYLYIHDNTTRIEFMGQQEINIDNYDKNLLKNSKKIFYYNKELYKSYLTNYLKHSSSANIPWYKAFSNYYKTNKNSKWKH
jgi:hypothetical protein